MKTIAILLVIFICFLFVQISNAQVNDPSKIAKDAATSNTNNNVNNSIENQLNKAENTLKGLFKKKNKEVKPATLQQPTSAPSSTTSSTVANTSASTTANPAINTPTGQSKDNLPANEQITDIKVYQNYDFRAGDKIIFDDNFVADQDGEFPAHWDLTKGQAVINKCSGIPCFFLTDGNYCDVLPRMTTKTYLTANFSVEYDIFMTHGSFGLIIYFYDESRNNNMSVHLNAQGVEWVGSSKTLAANHPGTLQNENFFNKFHHIAIAYKNDQLKVYVDQFRVLTVPHCDLKPSSLDCMGIGSQENPIIYTNFKIADGAQMNMLDAIMTTGKFVTHGINFEVNKSVLRPESMGVIGDVAKYMQSHVDLKLEIDGHTDSDGSSELNMNLSQQRADAVKAALVRSGINESRLDTKGFGPSKPLGTNDTPEGKANNRRVEFVKM